LLAQHEAHSATRLVEKAAAGLRAATAFCLRAHAAATIDAWHEETVSGRAQLSTPSTLVFTKFID
jgi:hypothetical protein